MKLTITVQYQRTQKPQTQSKEPIYTQYHVQFTQTGSTKLRVFYMASLGEAIIQFLKEYPWAKINLITDREGKVYFDDRDKGKIA